MFNKVPKKRCQCCNRKYPELELTVRSSILGAVSSSYCKECIEQNAECEWIIKYHIDGKADLADWVWDIKVYKKGKYYKLSDYILKFL